MRSQPQRMNDPYFFEEHQRLEKKIRGWFTFEAKTMLEAMHKRTRRITWFAEQGKRADGYVYMTTAFFPLPQVPKDRVVIGGATFDADYLKENFLPGDARRAHRLQAGRGRRKSARHGRSIRRIPTAIASAGTRAEPLAASAGWTEGKPEVSRNFADVFPGLALGIKFQGTSVAALGRSWVEQWLSHPRRALAAAGRRPGADVPQRQQGSRAGPVEVRLRLQRVARVAYAAGAHPPLRGNARTGSHQGAEQGGGVLPHHPHGERAADRVDQQHPRLLAHRGRDARSTTSDRPTLRNS